MGCGASTNHTVSKPGGKIAPDDKSKKKDVQTTYRERLGEDFIAHFAKSEESILELANAVAPERSRSPGRAASSASTQAYDETLATGTLISPYTTPPTESLPDAHADAEAGDGTDAPVRGPQSTSSLLSLDLHDTSGPYISSRKSLNFKNSRVPSSRPGSRESNTSCQADDLAGASKKKMNVPARLQPLSHCGSVTRSTSPAPGGPQKSQLL